MDCTIYEAKTMVLISCAVTPQLICAFVFAYAKSRFSHDAAQLFHKEVEASHLDKQNQMITLENASKLTVQDVPQLTEQTSQYIQVISVTLSLFHISLAAAVHLTATTNFLVSYGSLKVL